MTNLCTKMNAQPGDIWGTSNGKEYLIIAKHDDQLYTVLGLLDAHKTGMVEVKSRQVMYTNPAMVQYLFGNVMSQYIKTLPQAEFETVVEAVQDALCLTMIKESPVEATDESHNAEVRELKARIDDQGKTIEFLHKSNDAAMEKCEDLARRLEEMTHYKEVYQELYLKTLDRVILMGKE